MYVFVAAGVLVYRLLYWGGVGMVSSFGDGWGSLYVFDTVWSASTSVVFFCFCCFWLCLVSLMVILHYLLLVLVCSILDMLLM